MGSSSKPKVEVSEYRMSLHLGFCYAVDYLLELFIKEKSVWKGTSTSNETLRVNLPTLFGGVKKEGGVVGAIEVMHGRSDQVASTELAGRLGTTSALAPGFRDILSLFFRGEGQGFLWSANYPYLHAVWAKVCRTKTGWYDAKSSIGSPVSANPSTYAQSTRALMYDVLARPIVVKREGNLVHVVDAVELESSYFGDYTSFPTKTAAITYVINADTGELDSTYLGANTVYAPPSGTYFVDAASDVWYWTYAYQSIGALDSKHFWSRRSSSTTRVITTDLWQFPMSGAVFLEGELSPSDDVRWFGVDGANERVLMLIYGGSWRYVEATFSGTVTRRGSCDTTRFDGTFGPSAVSGVAGFQACSYDSVTGILVTVAPGAGNTTITDIGQIDQDGVIRLKKTLTDVYPSGPSTGRGCTVNVNEYTVTVMPNFSATTLPVPVITYTPEVTPSATGPQMNPAHIIREVLTNTDWGLGIDGALIDDASFTAAADTLYDEGFGLSLQWTGQSSAEDFINDILAHIDATYGNDPATGKFYIKLIRGDYDPDDLDELTDDHITITSFTRNSLSDTSNEVVVTWTNPESEEEQTVTVHDIANYSTQGVIISTSRNYHAIRTSDLALRCAMRELGKVSQPVATFEVDANRMAIDYKSGDVVKVTYPEYGLNGLPCRIMSISRGKPGQMAVKMTLMEDVFNMPASAYVVSPGSGWEESPGGDQAVSRYRIESAPYYLVAKEIGDAEASALTYPEAFLAILAVGDGGVYEVYARESDPIGNMSFVAQGSRQYVGTATLTNPLVAAVTSAVTVTGLTTTPSVGMILFLGDELCVVESVSDATLTLRRGVLDTVPVDHPVGERLWFFTSELDIADPSRYTVGQSVAHKIVPEGSYEGSSMPIVSIVGDRAYRPYRPGNVRINGDLWASTFVDDIHITWSHRNRLLETSILPEWDDSSLTPEAGTTYSLVFKVEGVTIHTVTGITGTSYLFGANVPANPNWDDVRLAMRMDGPALTDMKGLAVSVSGSVSIDASTFVFGQSALFSGGRVFVGTTSDLAFLHKGGAWTVEGWVNPASFTDNPILFATCSGSTATVGAYCNLRTDGKLEFYVFRGASGTTAVALVTSHSVPVSTFSHVSLVSLGTGEYRVYLNGVMSASGTATSSHATSNSSSVFTFGGNPTSATSLLSGNLDDWIVTEGHALRTANFTPPDAPFLDETLIALSEVTVELFSVRDGFESYQRVVRTLESTS